MSNPEAALEALIARGDYIVSVVAGVQPWSEEFLRSEPKPVTLPLAWFNDLRLIAEEVRIQLRRLGRTHEIRDGRLTWYGRPVVSA